MALSILFLKIQQYVLYFDVDMMLKQFKPQHQYLFLEKVSPIFILLTKCFVCLKGGLATTAQEDGRVHQGDGGAAESLQGERGDDARDGEGGCSQDSVLSQANASCP